MVKRMIKYRKKQMLRTIHTLLEGNKSFEKKHSRNEQETLFEVLTRYQETAIRLGNYFETLGERGAGLVSILEEYCESLYQLSLVLLEDIRCRKITAMLQKQLERLEWEVRQQIEEDKPEVLFLPYNASMWDSLESVWLAAKEDESCDTYVVAIPYFDKNPDGTLGQMHYDGSEYPDYVPITTWEEYDIPERRPEMIYIHNPYDGSNRVTSVPPAFYSKELRKHTDMLVYIPYFVAVEDKLPEQFCILPGTMYADKIIVQSEEVRRTYLEEFYKLERENNCRGLFGNIDEKVLALGSPKYDGVLNKSKSDIRIPAEWKRIIEGADNKKRKIILYNTSISTILREKEKILDKIENVLKIFKEKREEIVLLWRPHPLSFSTFQSMDAHLYERYKKIVDKYRTEAWGIYDDSSDMDRAIVFSDGYYGDGGSVVELYTQTGKPIMLQNVDVIDEKVFL